MRSGRRFIEQPAVGVAIFLIWAAGMVVAGFVGGVGYWLWLAVVVALIGSYMVASWLRVRKSMTRTKGGLPSIDSHDEP